MIRNTDIESFINTQCYEFDYISFNKSGVFDPFIDITYIITMKSSERYNTINKKLELLNPTSTIIVVNNFGYKKCKKILHKQNSAYDLTNAYLNVFYHSIKHGYKNILILEDDFEFDIVKMKNREIIHDLHTFFIKHKEEEFIYNIGTVPSFFNIIPIDKNHYQGVKIGYSQSIIYSDKVRVKILIEGIRTEKEHFDHFITKHFTNYFYKTPLCYQVFRKTENSALWINGYLSLFFKIIGLDKKSKPGYEIYFYYSFINTHIHIFLFLILFSFILFNTIYIMVEGKVWKPSFYSTSSKSNLKINK